MIWAATSRGSRDLARLYATRRDVDVFKRFYDVIWMPKSRPVCVGDLA
jgi:hypothetical protein